MDGGYARAYQAFHQSLAANYSFLFALPSLVSFSLFGATRLVFLLTNFFCFLLPQEIALAFVLHRGLNIKLPQALLLSLSAGFLIPPLWVPLLQGYPDNSAAAALMGAFALTLGTKREGWRGLAFGVLLGLAVLFRRHYVYGVLTLLGATGLLDLFLTRPLSLKNLGRLVLFYGLCGLAAAGLMLAVAPDFVRMALTTHYGELYKSYTETAPVFLLHALDNFGLLLTAASLAGLALLLRRKNELALRVAVWGVLWLLVWSLGPAQLGPHYLLQMLPLVAVVGLAGWAQELFLSGRPARRRIGIVLLGLLLSGSVYAFGLADEGVTPNWYGTPGLFAAPHPPQRRVDFDALVALVDHLRQTTGPDDRVLIVGSSFNFNQDLMHAVSTDVFHEAPLIDHFLQAPEIDNVQPPPYDVFASANVFVIPEPAQYHLTPAGQKVVTALAEQFPPPPASARLFEVDDQVFNLQKGVKVRVWRRTKPWPPKVLLEAERKIETTAGQGDVPPRDWTILKMPLQAQQVAEANGLSQIQGYFGRSQPTLALLYNRALFQGNYRLEALLLAQPACRDLDLDLVQTDKDGGLVSQAKLASDLASTDGVKNISVPLAVAAKEEPVFVQISLRERPDTRVTDACIAALYNLALNPR
jgi:hypothetical protein